jgi:hypothetical protein
MSAKIRTTNYLGSLSVDKSRIPNLVKSVSDIGIDFTVLAEKHSRTSEKDDRDVWEILVANDIGLSETDDPYFDKQYREKINFLYKFAENTEIERILFSLCNSIISLNKNKLFCDVDTNNLTLNDSIRSSLQKNFKKIISLLGWDDPNVAWDLVHEFLIEGCVAYEVVFKYEKTEEVNKKRLIQKNKIDEIIGKIKGINEIKENKSKSKFLNESKLKDLNEQLKILEKEKISLNESLNLYEERIKLCESFRFDKKSFDKNSFINSNLDIDKSQIDFINDDLIPVSILGFFKIEQPETLIPLEWRYDANNKIKIWKKLKVNQKYEILPDNSIIMINWKKISGGGKTRRISYLERLIRNFNLTRKLEESRVAWNIMNSMFRMKMVVPINSKISSKAEQALREFTNKHRESISINDSTGEIKVNGDPWIKYNHNIVLPSKQGQQIDIDSIQFNGPDLTNMDVVKYFRDNMIRDSFIPKNRFDNENQGQLILFKTEGITYEEIDYNNLLNKFINEFSRIITKPLYNQMLMDHPELKIDHEFKTKLKINFVSDSYFEEAKLAEVDRIKQELISQDSQLMHDDGVTPIYSKKYLFVHKYKVMTEEEWDLNLKLVKENLMDNNGGNS